MFQSQKNAFWQALILAAFVFAAGILLGFLLENSRTKVIDNLYVQSELEMLDLRVQSDIFSLEGFDCGRAINENINFANKVYDEAKLLEKYEDENKMSEGLVLEHKKYDLLRASLWINSIKIGKKCGSSYHNVVYLYDYDSPSLEVRARQEVISRLLGDLKAKVGSRIMLIPLAGDNGISSISILMSSYNVSEAELPVVLIDEKIKLTDVSAVESIEKYLN